MNAMTESDAQQLIDIFPTITSRLIIISSGDVYMAHEKLCQSDSDIYEPIPLHENSKLRQQNSHIGNMLKILMMFIIHMIKA